MVQQSIGVRVVGIHHALAQDAGETSRGNRNLRRDLRSWIPRERAKLVAYVPQRSALDAPLPVATVVGHGRYAHSGSSVAAASAAIRSSSER